MNEVVDVEFREIQERTLPVIASEIKTIEEVVYKTTLEGVIQIGKRLEEAKGKVGHGSFSGWCKEYLGYSQRQAQKYMELSSKYSDENSPFSNANISSHLSISKAYSLLALPEEEVENFTEEHDIESLTVKQLEEEIKNLKEEKARELKEKTEEVQDLKKIMLQLENEKANIPDTEALEAELKQMREALEQAETEKEKLEKKVDKFKGKADRAEEEKEKAVKEVTDERDDAIKTAVNEAVEETYKEAQRAVEEEMAELRKQLNSADPALVKFKERFDRLQMCVASIKEAIEEVEDKQQQENMKKALKTALSQIQEAI
jgi:chromosome segregation ATPase